MPAAEDHDRQRQKPLPLGRILDKPAHPHRREISPRQPRAGGAEQQRQELATIHRHPRRVRRLGRFADCDQLQSRSREPQVRPDRRRQRRCRRHHPNRLNAGNDPIRHRGIDLFIRQRCRSERQQVDPRAGDDLVCRENEGRQRKE